MTQFCAQATSEEPFSNIFLTQTSIQFLVLDVQEDVKYLELTEHFRKFCGLRWLV